MKLGSAVWHSLNFTGIMRVNQGMMWNIPLSVGCLSKVVRWNFGYLTLVEDISYSLAIGTH